MTFIVHVLHSVYKLFEGRYYIAYGRKHKINLFVHSFLIENRWLCEIYVYNRGLFHEKCV